MAVTEQLFHLSHCPNFPSRLCSRGRVPTVPGPDSCIRRRFLLENCTVAGDVLLGDKAGPWTKAEMREFEDMISYGIIVP